jgi:hypothetical protein
VIRRRTETKIIFIHCSATRAKQDIGARTIHAWHAKQGIYNELGLTGYHRIIRRSGAIELGRPLAVWGAHALGYNESSIGICLVGGAERTPVGEEPDWGNMTAVNNFTRAQFDSLEILLRSLLLTYPDAVVAPHNAVANKACPSFDVWAWQESHFGYNDRLRTAQVLAELAEDGEDDAA